MVGATAAPTGWPPSLALFVTLYVVLFLQTVSTMQVSQRSSVAASSSSCTAANARTARRARQRARAAEKAASLPSGDAASVAPDVVEEGIAAAPAAASEDSRHAALLEDVEGTPAPVTPGVAIRHNLSCSPVKL